MLIFGGKAYGGPIPPPLAYAVYAFINVDNCERPLTVTAFTVLFTAWYMPNCICTYLCSPVDVLIIF